MGVFPRFVVFVVVVGAPTAAAAHLGLDAPVSRYGPDTLKTGPCGVEGGARTDNVTYFEPGETIEVRWNEYIIYYQCADLVLKLGGAPDESASGGCSASNGAASPSWLVSLFMLFGARRLARPSDSHV